MVRNLGGDAPDLIWVYSSWLAGSFPDLDWSRVVVDFDTLFFRSMRSTMRHSAWYGSKILAENTEIWKQELFDRRLSKRAARVVVCSEDDQRILGYDNVQLLPNCVDVQDTPANDAELPHRLLFVGKMDYHPNVDAVLYFCKSILPRILDREPRAQLYIVGREPSDEIRALHNGITVFVTGAVPDTTPYFHAAGLVIAPVRCGGGTRVKLLEAFAHQKAVVATTIACEGLAVEQGVHLYQADAPQDFAARCLALMSDALSRKALGIAGRDLVERRYSHAVFQRTVQQCVSQVTGAL
jgi:glycosyltransferase involved in cell wall biosynthesis